MSKYLKLSLVTAVLYIALGLLLSTFSGWYVFLLEDFGGSVVGNAAFYISYSGMVLAALISTITGLVATYHALKMRNKWWYVITIYAAANALIVFSSAFVSFTI